MELRIGKPPGRGEHSRAIKDWVAGVLGLPDDASVMVTELRCAEPGCPPLETVIAVLLPGQPPRQFKIHKPLGEVARDDVERHVAPGDPVREEEHLQ